MSIMHIAYQTSIFWLLCSLLLLFSSIFLLLIVICEKAYEIWSPSYSICFSIEFTCLFWGGHGAWGQFLLFCIMNYVEITRCPRKNVRLHAKLPFYKHFWDIFASAWILEEWPSNYVISSILHYHWSSTNMI